MKSVFIRNFIILAFLLVAAGSGLSYVLLYGDRNIESIDDRIQHTHAVIIDAQEVSTLFQILLASQRGYLLTGDENFLDDYNKYKSKLSDLIAELTELTIDNPSQQSRLDETRNYMTEFINKLDERASKFKPTIRTPDFLNDIKVINELRENFIKTNQAILSEEYGLLNSRVSILERRKENYRYILLTGISAGTLILLLFNAYIFYSQFRNLKTQSNLKISEDRYALVIEGTQDGIFDWDIKSNIVNFSAQYFAMLGYDRKSETSDPERAKALIHPDDLKDVEEYTNNYLNGLLSEYCIVFRMKHKSGRWVWIQSRATALFDKQGKATRLVGSHADITASKQIHEKLELDKLHAEQANKAKTEFLAHMSHEIRTPLTAINGIAEILEKKPENMTEKQRQLVKTLLNSSSSLKDLINDLLDFSKIESGELELNNENFYLEDVFQGVISIMALKASEKGISFVFDYNETKEVEFFGDSMRLRQILINLVGNAVKFTDEGAVKILAQIEEREQQEFLRVEVSDTGIGISTENFDLVFDRFKQADSSVSRKYGGTGLGLPISKKLAQQMDGNIFLSSEYGKGSVFTLFLPFKNSSKNVVPRSNQEHLSKLNDKIKAQLNNETKILIVEDYKGNIVVLTYILDDLNLPYDIARNGLEAVAKWKDNHYDLILMDVQMPEMDGFSATKEIRLIEAKQGIERTPIVAMTAHALIGDKDKCIEAGMDDYLPKPIVEDDLKKTMLNFLSKERKSA